MREGKQNPWSILSFLSHTISRLPVSAEGAVVIIDCDVCVMDGTGACADCIVPMLLSGTGGPTRIGDDEERAIRNLSNAGLVSPIRLVARGPGRGAATG
jgi:hypothetical protein